MHSWHTVKTCDQWQTNSLISSHLMRLSTGHRLQCQWEQQTRTWDMSWCYLVYLALTRAKTTRRINCQSCSVLFVKDAISLESVRVARSLRISLAASVLRTMRGLILNLTCIQLNNMSKLSPDKCRNTTSIHCGTYNFWMALGNKTSAYRDTWDSRRFWVVQTKLKKRTVAFL